MAKTPEVNKHIELMSSPWKDIRISIIVPARGKAPFINLFHNFLMSAIETCSNPDIVEMLIKIDSEDMYKPFYLMMLNSPFKFKILCYPKYNARLSVQYFDTDLSKIASGDLIWLCSDEIKITKGDWVKSLLKTREMYPDNIYAVRFSSHRSYPAKATTRGNPYWAISKEWFNILGNWCEFPNSDRWIFILSRLICRQVLIHDVDIIRIHPNATPYSAGSPFLKACVAKTWGFYKKEIERIFASKAVGRLTLLKEDERKSVKKGQ